jgi:D-3-phosphoglycerate dehydrogenase
MSLSRVLILDPVHPDGPAHLRAAGIEVVHLPRPEEAEILAHMPRADALILRGRHLSEAAWDAGTGLRLVSRHGVGCDNVDFARMGRQGVTVAVTADANSVSVAEHAFALMLAALKRLPAAARHAAGDWAGRDGLGARQLHGAEVLVAGFGRIGRAFAARAQAFGARVAVFDPELPPDAPLPEGAARATELGEAVARADIVSLHMPALPATRGLFDAALLARLAPGATLVNTARGGIVDEAALLDRLSRDGGTIYATDVLAHEPPEPDDPLLSHPQVIVTPHSAAMTREGARLMSLGAAQNVTAFRDGALPARMVAFAP